MCQPQSYLLLTPTLGFPRLPSLSSLLLGPKVPSREQGVDRALPQQPSMPYLTPSASAFHHMPPKVSHPDIQAALSALRVCNFRLTRQHVNPLDAPGGSDGEESACSAGDPGSIPALGRCPGEENGYPLQYSCLENFMDRGAGGLQSMELQGLARLRGKHFHFQRASKLTTAKRSETCRHCSVTKSCPTVCDPMDCSTSGSPILHCLLKFAQIHVHRVSDTA